MGNVTKLPVNNTEWIKDSYQFNGDFIKYESESDERYFWKLIFNILTKLHELHNDFPFLPKRMKIEIVKKIVANLHDKTEHAIHIRNLKQGLNQYIAVNTDVRKNARKKFEKDFFKLMNNAVFRKTMKTMRK